MIAKSIFFSQTVRYGCQVTYFCLGRTKLGIRGQVCGSIGKGIADRLSGDPQRGNRN
jgi:hypothetical protein